MNLAASLLMTAAGLADGGFQGVMKSTPLQKFAFLSFSFLFALPYYAVWVVKAGATVELLFWLVLVVHVPIFLWGNILLIEALRVSSLAATTPLLALTAAYVVPLDFLVALWTGKGWPTAVGAIGVLIATCGLYVHNIRTVGAGPIAPFRNLAGDRGARLALAASALFAVTAALDPIALKYASIQFYLAADHGLLAILSGALALWYVASGRATLKDVRPTGLKVWGMLLLAGLAIALSVIAHMFALDLGAPVSYVAAVKRSWSILFTVALGLFLAADERKRLTWQIPGAIVMLFGMAVILIWGRTV